MYLNNPNRRVLYWLYVFYLCAKYKSMTEAAIHVSNDVATISEAMNNLEYFLGVNLRVAGKPGFKLTIAGKELLNQVESSLEHLEEVMVGLESFNDRYTQNGEEVQA